MMRKLDEMLRDHAGLWSGMRDNLLDKVSELQKQLEKPQSEIETAMLRGRIKQIRQIIEEVDAPAEAARRASDRSKEKPLPSIY
jgi:16S rRNA U516 pseudouridylate synthase RsuA-like enzyme